MPVARDLTNEPTRSRTPSRPRTSKTGTTPSNKLYLSNRTPAKGGSHNNSTLNRSSRLTPCRNQNVSSRTPGGGDRFIPIRSTSQIELSNFLLTSASDSQLNTSQSAPSSPSKAEYQRIMSSTLNGGVTAPTSEQNDSDKSYRILAYQKGKAPLAPQGVSNQHRVLYSARATPSTSCKKANRHINSLPDRILDAPEIMDDYYLNLIDWNSKNFLAVALAGQLYVWNAANGEISLLEELESQTDYFTSVKWTDDANYLSVGLSTGHVQLWDPVAGKKLRTMDGHAMRVACLAWNRHVLTAGCREGLITNHDVRVQHHLLSTVKAHSQEVCGLSWCPSGRLLASGGNDNLLQIWGNPPADFQMDSEPLHRLTDHQAAVKALAWCPWQPSVLASGGGTADRCLKLWNTNCGSLISSTDAMSQVCSVLWSSEYKELISGHGYPSHQLCIWKYPAMTKVAELMGHTARVLSLSMSPCKEYVVSASADESLRIWHCFAVDPAQKKRLNQSNNTQTHKTNGIVRGIR